MTGDGMIGVFGGTFDPVHYGHLRSAVEVLQRLSLDEVLMLPCGTPPHREPTAATGEQRRRMLELAIEGHPGLCVDDRELRRAGPSYMVDTLESLQSERGDTALCLVLGLDAYLGLPRWHRWERILDLANVAVLHRPGVTMPNSGITGRLLTERGGDDPRALRGQRSGTIVTVPVTQLEISATQIRDLVSAGHSAGFLLPDAVLALIQVERLYQS